MENFATLGPRLFRAGYTVIPCKPGGKRPGFDDWQNVAVNGDQVAYWAGNGRGAWNVGIRTGEGWGGVAGFDIDVLDPEVAARIVEAAIDKFGRAPLRVGRAPKSLLVYACDDEFRKITSPRWRDPAGQIHRVEILGKGQQFIAYGIHPDTGRPYNWPDRDLLEAGVSDLPVVKAADLAAWIADELPKLIPADWVLEGAAKVVPIRPLEEDPFADFKDVLEIDADGIRAALANLDPDVEFDDWVRVGMALHHQYRGGDAGLDLWDEWSQRGAKYDGDELVKQWRTFESAPGRTPVTFASVLKMAQDVKASARHGAIDGWKGKIEAATSRAQIQEEIAREIRRDPSLDRVGREILAKAVQTRIKALDGVSLPIAVCRDLAGIGSKRGTPLNPQAPAWIEPWVYLTADDVFFNLETAEGLSEKGFRARYDREVAALLGDGEEEAEVNAARLALNTWRIPAVYRQIYLPQADRLFSIDGVDYCNSYREAGIPEVPVDLLFDDEMAIGYVERHLENIVPDDRERRILLDWMAFNVQNPGKKIRWAVYLKGTEGDGKSVLGEILAAAMGQGNVRTLNARTLESDFTGWAVGQCVTVIEEAKQHGHNRHDVANALKAYISNDTIEVHAKGRDPFNAPNTSNYLVLTNFADGLPIGETSRRYFVVFTPFGNGEEVLAAGMDGRYFASLFGAIRGHSGAIRRWLLERDLSTFDADGRAPETEHKADAANLAKNDDEEILEDVLEIGGQGIGPSVLSSAHVSRAMNLHGAQVRTNRVKSLLTAAGFVQAGRFRWNGEVCRVWVKRDRRKADFVTLRAELDATLADGGAGEGKK